MSTPHAPTRAARRNRLAAFLVRACVVGGLLGLLAATASAQKVAPRLTGAMVVTHLDKAREAVLARAAAKPDDQLAAIAAKLKDMGASLGQALGDDGDQPLETISRSTRDAAVRAEAAAKRVEAFLQASAEGCTEVDAHAMATVVATTLARLAADTSDQKAPLPVIEGVETLDQRPLFVLRQGEAAPKFVLTGANLVDTQCANPAIVAFGPDGKRAAVQPKLVAAQPGQVELEWADAASLAPGTYVIQLTAQRKAFLFGCGSEPPTVALLQVAPPLEFTVSYALSATCDGGTAPLVLGSGTLPPLTARERTATQDIDVSACADPTSYTVAATIRGPNGSESKYGPVSQSAAATITTGLGNGLTLSWEPSLHQLVVSSGKNTCKGVY